MYVAGSVRAKEVAEVVKTSEAGTILYVRGVTSLHLVEFTPIAVHYRGCVDLQPRFGRGAAAIGVSTSHVFLGKPATTAVGLNRRRVRIRLSGYNSACSQCGMRVRHRMSWVPFRPDECGAVNKQPTGHIET